MQEVKIGYIVGLRTYRRRHGQIILGSVVKWASGGLNDTGREKIRCTQKRQDAFAFSKESAEFIARKLKGWGYFPVVLEKEEK